MCYQCGAAESVLDVCEGGWSSQSGSGAGAYLSHFLSVWDPQTHPEGPAGVWALGGTQVNAAFMKLSIQQKDQE